MDEVYAWYFRTNEMIRELNKQSIEILRTVSIANKDKSLLTDIMISQFYKESIAILEKENISNDNKIKNMTDRTIKFNTEKLKIADEETLKKTNYCEDLRVSIKEYAYQFKEHWEKNNDITRDLARLIQHVEYGVTKKWGVDYANFGDYMDIIAIDLPIISNNADKYLQTFMSNHSTIKII